jgi:hypothetical protein
MRWLYLDPRNPQEAAYRDEKLARIDAWWREFTLQSSRIHDLFSRRAQWDLPAWMHEHLGAVDERLMWEFGPAVKGEGDRLVITPEAEHWLRPLLATILERAPRLPDWEFYAYRLPESVEVAEASVQGRTGGDLSGTTAEARIGEGNRIDLVFRSPLCRGPDDEAASAAAFVAAETLLGEETLDRWLGGIDVAPPAKTGWLSKLRGGETSRALPLDRLRPTVESLIGSIVDQLPPAPCHEFIDQGQQWSMVELHPEEQDDYVERTDLFVAVTGHLDMWKAAHGGGIFHSGRFSRQGETFCYLKIDGSEGLEGSQFSDRSEIEDAVNAVLAPAAAGCVVGGGTGRRYSYIDLALVDCPRAVPLLREVLSAGRVPERTWLQFFDDDLSQEWVGVYDTTTPPPL